MACGTVTSSCLQSIRLRLACLSTLLRDGLKEPSPESIGFSGSIPRRSGIPLGQSICVALSVGFLTSSSICGPMRFRHTFSFPWLLTTRFGLAIGALLSLL